MNRRTFLSALPAFPLAAQQAAAKAAQGLAGVATASNIGGAVKGQTTLPVDRPARLVTDFAEYLKTDDAASLWEDAVRDARGQLDPDIAGHRSWSPYQKLRAQAQRNYRVNVAARKTWFDRLVATSGGWRICERD